MFSIVDWIRHFLCPEISILTKEIDECRKSKDKLLNELDKYKSLVGNLKDEIDKLKNENKKLQEDLDYFKHRTDLLLQALGESIQIPDISEYIKEKTLIKPYELDAFKDYDLLCADYEYYAFPRKAWIEILNLIHQQVKKILGSWRKEIANCDNWALVTCTMVYLAFDKAGLDRQGAISIAWSRTHAYNNYIPSDDLRTWLYEPQGNTHVGILSKDAVETYKTWGIWFMGKKKLQ